MALVIKFINIYCNGVINAINSKKSTIMLSRYRGKREPDQRASCKHKESVLLKDCFIAFLLTELFYTSSSSVSNVKLTRESSRARRVEDVRQQANS